MRYDAFPTAAPTSYGASRVPFHTLMGIGTGTRSHDLAHVPYLRSEWDVPDWAVMLDGDGHTWVALDYRVTGDPAAVWIEVIGTEDGQPTVVPLAPSFDAFLAGLHVGDRATCWGSSAPTAVVLDAIRTRHGVRLSSYFDAVVLPPGAQSTGSVQLKSSRGRLDELVWPEFPAIRSILRFDIETDQRDAAAAWVDELGVPTELVHVPLDR